MSFKILTIFLFSACLAFAKDVAESARTLPMAYDVDVVVVGGSSGGVEAAVAAAKAGAKVFLAAPRPYLGDDICGTGRMWLEPSEKPVTDLAKEVFKFTPPATIPKGISFSYKADKPCAKVHKDTVPPSMLNDGQAENPSKHSVQFDSEVTLTLDLAKQQHVRKITVLAFQRGWDFAVGDITVFTSIDGKEWREAANIKNQNVTENHEEKALLLEAELKANVRHLKLKATVAPESKRILLGEIVVQTDQSVVVPKLAEGAPLVVTPMQVKRTFDTAMLDAGVQFLYGSYATDLLRDESGKPAGVVIANRSGRQAVRAKVIIDATDRATVARLAKAKFSPYPAQTQKFTRIVVGGEPRKGDNLNVRQRSTPIFFSDRNGSYPVIEYEVQVPMRDGSFRAFSEAEQMARDWTWTKEQIDASDIMFQVPPDSFRSRAPQSGPWVGADKISIEAFQPEGVERVFALNGCADLSREAAAELLRPVNLMAVGARVGQAAASLAKSQPKPDLVKVPAEAPKKPLHGEVGEVSASINPRWANAQPVSSETHSLPVLGEFDVVVVGGGTGGAPAAISAGRQGAKTLLLEYMHGLGGVGTVGRINIYYHGYRQGFTAEIDKAIEAMGTPTDAKLKKNAWDPGWKSEWYRTELRKHNVELWYGVLGTGAVTEKGRVRGVVVATPQGRGVVMAKVVIDATGSSDVAAAAGATCTYTDDSEFAMQGVGLPPRELATRVCNTDYTFIDETDVVDIWRAMVMARHKFKGAYDVSQFIDSRERRQIIGDFTITPLDQWIGRTYPDTVVLAKSNYDTHGYTTHPMFYLRAPHKQDIFVHIPYRCLLPKGLDGIIVIGLGISAHRDAIPLTRMQPDIQNMGYAMGVAAATLAKKNIPTRKLDVKALQKHLVEKGNLPDVAFLTHKDSLPMPNEAVVKAVATLVNEFAGLEVVLSHQEVAMPLLREALSKAADPKVKLAYANVLGMLGDNSGADVLLQAVSSASWDKGWQFKSGGQFGTCLSQLDSLILALGRTRDPRAVEPIAAKAAQLTAESEFSHFRTIALAMEAIGSPAATKSLAEVLKKPDIGGHSVTNLSTALQQKNPPNGADTSVRNVMLRELHLARALYRCGDYEGLGEKTLKQFAQDLHGHYARHAQAVLKQKPGGAQKP